MVNTKVNLSGMEMDNPIIPASGTFGYGYEFAELYDINELGTFSFKGTTKDPRFGNPTPRIAECREGMINSVGLQNPGVEKVISEELPKLKKCFDKKVMANVRLCDNKSCEMGNAPVVMPLSLTKGLEFDSVVVCDMGGFSGEENKPLLYMASTRALHKLNIFKIK